MTPQQPSLAPRRLRECDLSYSDDDAYPQQPTQRIRTHGLQRAPRLQMQSSKCNQESPQISGSQVCLTILHEALSAMEHKGIKLAAKFIGIAVDVCVLDCGEVGLSECDR